MTKKHRKKILFAGDSPVGGAANYLLGVLGTLPVEVRHVPPGQKLTHKLIENKFDAYIFSDYSKSDLVLAVEKKIAQHVEEGAGLLMIGGWCSFTGLGGRWKGSLIESLLPVNCLARDDRRNISSGLILRLQRKHAMFKSLSFDSSPVICGLNEVKLNKNSQVILSAATVLNKKGKVRLASKSYPLLVVDRDQDKKRAALMTDLAPHWTGGWVDWGSKRKTLTIANKYQIEVGHQYIGFIQSLIRWLLSA